MTNVTISISPSSAGIQGIQVAIDQTPVQDGSQLDLAPGNHQVNTRFVASTAADTVTVTVTETATGVVLVTCIADVQAGAMFGLGVCPFVVP